MAKLEKFLEKAGLIYTENTEETPVAQIANKPVVTNHGTQSQATSVSSATDGDVIKEAYDSLPKSENDVFIVEQLMQNFNMLPDETKPTVVKQTLATMHVDVGRLLTEATAKKNALTIALERRNKQVNSEIDNLNAIISEAEKKISDCKKQQLSKKSSLENANKQVLEETKRLENIIKILGGGK